MGIYDREYYRRDGPSFLGSLADRGQVTNGLIGLNVLCFLVQMLTRSPEGAGPFTEWLSLDAGLVLGGQVWRLLTYAFLHSTESIMHLLFNMLFLFWFGRQVEEVIGGREYLRFYLLSAVLAGVAFAGSAYMGFHGPPPWVAVGASGAVTAVLILAAFFNPRQVIYLFFVLPVPIWGFVILNVAMDLFGFLGHSEGVATSAHLGGAAFAFVYYKRGWRLSGFLYWLPRFQRSRPRPQLKLYREEEEKAAVATRQAASRPAAAARVDDEQLEAQVDVILEKIARVGMEGLTEPERNLLLRASEIMKRRRS